MAFLRLRSIRFGCVSIGTKTDNSILSNYTNNIVILRIPHVPCTVMYYTSTPVS